MKREMNDPLLMRKIFIGVSILIFMLVPLIVWKPEPAQLVIPVQMYVNLLAAIALVLSARSEKERLPWKVNLFVTFIVLATVGFLTIIHLINLIIGGGFTDLLVLDLLALILIVITDYLLYRDRTMF